MALSVLIVAGESCGSIAASGSRMFEHGADRPIQYDPASGDRIQQADTRSAEPAPGSGRAAGFAATVHIAAPLCKEEPGSVFAACSDGGQFPRAIALSSVFGGKHVLTECDQLESGSGRARNRDPPMPASILLEHMENSGCFAQGWCRSRHGVPSRHVATEGATDSQARVQFTGVDVAAQYRRRRE